jgi:GNAT superfamily N-acetyltransferase
VSADELEYVVTDALPDSYAHGAAQLILSAFPEFYEIFSQDTEEAIGAIRTSFYEATEINQLVLAVSGGTPCGVLCYYDLAERQARQAAGLLGLMRICSDGRVAMQRMRTLMPHFGHVVGAGVYVSRYSVDPKFWGCGIAATLIDFLCEEVELANEWPLYLHVQSENGRARNYYENMDFEEIEPRIGSYAFMRRGVRSISQ